MRVSRTGPALSRTRALPRPIVWQRPDDREFRHGNLGTRDERRQGRSHHPIIRRPNPRPRDYPRPDGDRGCGALARLGISDTFSRCPRIVRGAKRRTVPTKGGRQRALRAPPFDRRARLAVNQEDFGNMEVRRPLRSRMYPSPTVVFFRLRGISATNSSPPCDCITIVRLGGNARV